MNPITHVTTCFISSAHSCPKWKAGQSFYFHSRGLFRDLITCLKLHHQQSNPSFSILVSVVFVLYSVGCGGPSELYYSLSFTYAHFIRIWGKTNTRLILWFPEQASLVDERQQRVRHGLLRFKRVKLHTPLPSCLPKH